MKTSTAPRRLLGSPFIAIALLLVAGASVRAEDVAPVSSAVTPDAVLDLVRRDKLRVALELASPGRAALDSHPKDARARRLGLLWAVLRASCLSLDAKATRDYERDDEASVRRSLALAGERALPDDIAFLRELASSSERAAPYARVLVREACAKIDATSDRIALLGFLRGDDGTAKRRAIAAVGERLARIRAKVDSGGDLDALEQAELADPALIHALVDELGNRQADADALAHDLAASSTPSPLHALALIEAPSIPTLEAARRRGAPGADEALAAVREAARERLRKNPRSTWSSARGAMPQVVPDALACTGCKKPLPESARFCPSCGASSPGAPCPRCGQTAVGEICPRCGGVASAKVMPKTCEKCAEPTGAGDRFCRRCGVGLPGAQPGPPKDRDRDAPSFESPAFKGK